MNRSTRFGLVAALLLLLPVLAHGGDIIKYEVKGKTFYTDNRAKIPATATNIREFVSKQQAALASVARDEPGGRFKILSVDTKVTETNDVFWKYAYILKVKNFTDRPLTGHADLQWLDKDGFVIDDTRERRIHVPARSAKTVQGYQLISTGPAGHVQSINASVNLN